MDDEVAIRRLLALTLRDQGVAVLEAGGGDEAVAVFDRHRAQIGAILLDVQMWPVDGVATFRALRGRAPDVPIVVMTGSAGNDACDTVRRLGAVTILSKPFQNLADVGLLLRRLLVNED